MNRWLAQAQVSGKTHDGWSVSRSVPTFEIPNWQAGSVAAMAALKAADIILTMADSGRDYRVAVTVLDVESEAQEAETYLVTRPAGGSLTVERWRL